MRSLVLISLLVGLVSCGSADKKITSTDEFAGIENADFKPKKTVPYIEKKDMFTGVESKTDALSKESINRVPAPKLETVAEYDDPVNAGIGLCYQKKFKQAFAVLDKAYEKFRKHPSYWNQIGTCYLLQNDYRKALLYYNKALSINSKYAPTLNNFGVLYQKRGKDQEAIAAYKKAAQVNKFSLTLVFNLANLYLRYGFINKAGKIYQSLHRKNKNDIDVLNGIASFYLMSGNPKKAIGFFDMIDDDQLYRPDISINYAYSLKLVGRKSDAIDIIKNIKRKNLGRYAGYYARVYNYIGE